MGSMEDPAMNQKLNHVAHDSRAGTIFISLRPKSQRRPVTSLECPCRVILDIDAEGDIYGLRLLGVMPDDAEKILQRLKAGPEKAPQG